MSSSITVVPRSFGVVDLFAGPGGLAEGFSALEVEGHRPFKVCLSVEMERAAHQTLLLRTFLREFDGGFPNEYYDWLNSGSDEPDWNAIFPAEMARAKQIALRLELGNADHAPTIRNRIDAIRTEYSSPTVLIGGPPCQAYSLVGRARNSGKAGYDAAADKRHFIG
jgi:DNA (cytosine-5)-methyltransferase 1